MQRTVTYATGVYWYLSKISFVIQIFKFFSYHPGTLYFCEQGCEDLWLFFEAIRGPYAKRFG